MEIPPILGVSFLGFTLESRGTSKNGMFLLQILKMSILAFEACLPLSEETVVDVIQNDVPRRQAVDRGVVCEIVPLAVFLLTDFFLWLAVSDLLAFCRDRVISNSRFVKSPSLGHRFLWYCWSYFPL